MASAGVRISGTVVPAVRVTTVKLGLRAVRVRPNAQLERQMAPVRALLAEIDEARAAGFDHLHPSETIGRVRLRFRAHRVAHAYMDVRTLNTELTELAEPVYVQVCASTRRTQHLDRRHQRDSCMIRVLIAAPNAPGVDSHGYQG